MRESPLSWEQVAIKEAIKCWTGLFGAATFQDWAAGTVLFQEGKLAHNVFFLIKGLVLLSRNGPASVDEACGIRVPGQLLDQCAHCLSVPYRHSAKTITQAKIGRISIQELEQRRSCDPSIGQFFERNAALDLHQTFDFVEQLQSATPAECMERSFQLLTPVANTAEYPGRYVGRPTLFEGQIACILGVSTRQFERIKKRMHDEGRPTQLPPQR